MGIESGFQKVSCFKSEVDNIYDDTRFKDRVAGIDIMTWMYGYGYVQNSTTRAMSQSDEDIIKSISNNCLKKAQYLKLRGIKPLLVFDNEYRSVVKQREAHMRDADEEQDATVTDSEFGHDSVVIPFEKRVRKAMPSIRLAVLAMLANSDTL